MQKYLDGWDVAAHIRFVRQKHKGAILIVEGETDDKLLSNFVDEGLCSIEIAFGKPNVLECLGLLEDDGFLGVVAVVDADFDRIEKVAHSLEGLIYTDLHDLDMTVIFSPAGERYIKEKSVKERLSAVGLQKILHDVKECATQIAYCRLANHRNQLMLNFKKLDFQFVSDKLSLDRESMLECIIKNSHAPGCDIKALDRIYSKIVEEAHDPLQLCNGHDVAAILGIALRKLLADRPKQQTWSSEVSSDIRLAFGENEFNKTRLYEKLLDWERANKKYSLFSDNDIH